MVGPNYVAPKPKVPDAWEVALSRGLAQGEADLQTWWTLLGDPLLDRLIERARQANPNVRAALARIDVARAQNVIVASPLFPAVQATGAVQRSREHTRIDGDIVDVDRTVTTPACANTLQAIWEMDVFGRIRRSIEAAGAGYEATVDDYHDVLVLLSAQVAAVYVNVRTLQARLQYAEENVKAQRDTLKLTQDRQKAQIASDLDVCQADLNLAVTESSIPALRSGLSSAIHALGMLLGESPEALRAELTPVAPIPKTPPKAAVGLPANLLRQRPDVRAAERSLAAQTAQIGVAIAGLYPNFSLFGTLEHECAHPDPGNPTRITTSAFGASYLWTLFAGGALRANIRLQKAATRGLLAQYENTVLVALQETEDAMVAFAEEQERRDVLTRAVATAKKTVVIVEAAYKAGAADFLNVLDAQRTLTQVQDQLAQSEGSVVLDLISLYKALGGGWAVPSPPTAPAAQAEAPPKDAAALKGQ
jgi:NodT family efflux transporter outer membrane factor (OMF) lipoprotein